MNCWGIPASVTLIAVPTFWWQAAFSYSLMCMIPLSGYWHLSRLSSQGTTSLRSASRVRPSWCLRNLGTKFCLLLYLICVTVSKLGNLQAMYAKLFETIVLNEILFQSIWLVALRPRTTRGGCEKYTHKTHIFNSPYIFKTLSQTWVAF